ncbi:protein of unknown function [Legionella pneumophila subsp. pneumophila]|nr:protein of unknown function [Legionella pneumophila subsp. pneumophila]
MLDSNLCDAEIAANAKLNVVVYVLPEHCLNSLNKQIVKTPPVYFSWRYRYIKKISLSQSLLFLYII